MSNESSGRRSDVDVVVVGAGFAGMYLLHRLRGLGLSTRVLESADDVGGTWYWNRYPGARCDIQSLDYSFSFDPELDRTWEWSEKYATQPEILRYAQHVADRYDLRRDIDFRTKVDSAVWDDAASRWTVTTSSGERITTRWFVMATGCLSVPKEVDIPGADDFAGPVYFTSRWPHEGVDFTGRRVAVIGTGSSAIQSIPVIARQAAALTVFQRTPNFSIPAHNGPVPEERKASKLADLAGYRTAARWSSGGVPVSPSTVSAMSVSPDERIARYEEAWQHGGLLEFLGCYSDHLSAPDANEALAEFVRSKIRSIVHDPVTAEALSPRSHPIGSKRLCVDTGYYATFNEPHVRLVDLREHPIVQIVERGIELSDETIEFDDLVFATGFDAMTGAVVNVDIRGREGRTLADAWDAGPVTYLGLTVHGFPNLFLVTGPGSPSVLTNMIMSIEQHVDWITECIDGLRRDGHDSIEPTPGAVAGWVGHVNDFAALTMFPQANSWYMGANVPGKPRVFMPYPAGLHRYREACDEVVARGYLGFTRRGATTVTNDGVIRPLAADVGVMLEMMAAFQVPPLESMSPPDARAFMAAGAAVRPPGPEVGEQLDGTFPGADGPLAYRLYRPASPGPHDVVLYFHGGGWVIGDHVSDEPFCRDLCVQADVIVVSVDYRHGPEHRFPAAVDDAVAALEWISANAEQLGGTGRPVVVAGWSAGGNQAAVVSQIARDRGGPTIAGQLLLTPATDPAGEWPSMTANGEGYVLTRSLMEWFVNHYIDEADRADPRIAPLRAASLAGLPPAMVVTCEFDPLRDEGNAYAAALSAAGVQVQHLQCPGQIHTSLQAVGALVTGAPARAEMAAAIRRFFGR